MTKWSENVGGIAEEIVSSYVFGTECKYQPLPKQQTNSIPNSQDDTFKCEICNRIFVGNYQWSQHLKSHKHRKVLEKKRKIEKEKHFVETTHVLNNENKG